MKRNYYLNLFIIGLGGFLGAVMRYTLSAWVYRLIGTSSLPYGTLVVNIAGSFVLGFFMFYGEGKWAAASVWRNFVAIGMMGALTTFSTFSYETFLMLQDNLYGEAVVNVLLNVFLTLAAVWLGMSLSRIL